MAAVLACAFFSAVSGSSPATVVAVGSVMIGGMIASGYSPRFASGVICNAGAILTLAMMAAVAVIAKRQNLPRQPSVGIKGALVAGRRAFWGLVLLVIILGGIYAGIFTPTEAAAVYAFVVAVFVYKDIKIGNVPGVLTEAAKTTAMLMFIIANAYLFAFVLTTEQIPQAASEWIVGLGLPAWGFLIVVNILLLIFGNFMEPTSVVLILTPIIFPIATQMGIDPIHLGIMIVLNMEIGLVTPPVGLNLFVTSSVAKMSMEEVISAALPWLMVLLSVLIIVTYIPGVSLIVPSLLGVL